MPRHSTQRPQSSSFLGLPYRILYMNPKKELLWGLWVATQPSTLAVCGPWLQRNTRWMLRLSCWTYDEESSTCNSSSRRLMTSGVLLELSKLSEKYFVEARSLQRSGCPNPPSPQTSPNAKSYSHSTGVQLCPSSAMLCWQPSILEEGPKHETQNPT